MISFSGVDFSYDRKTVLQNFSLTLPVRGVTLLTGPSGCGKSTLLRLLAGLSMPARGTVTSPPAGKTSILFQEDRLFPWRTAREQICDVLPAKRRADFARFLAFVELSGEENSYPAALSGGMKRRLALARAIACPSDLYLLDEPFGGLDTPLRMRIFSRLRELGTPIILTGHEAELPALCDTVVRLDGPPLTLSKHTEF